MADQSTPTSVTIASGLLIAWGTYALVTMILGWATGMGLFSIDLGFVGIPIGAGVLSGSQTLRKWAIFFAGMCLVTGGGMSLKWIGSMQAATQAMDVAVWAILMLGAAFVVWALCAKRNREWFGTRIETSGGIQARSFVWAMFIVVMALVALQFATWMRMEAAFAVHCRLIPMDSQTSKQLQSMRWSCEELALAGRGKLSSSSQGDASGISVNLEGVAFTPLNVVVKADGYEPGTITIVPGLSGDQPVLLKPARQESAR